MTLTDEQFEKLAEVEHDRWAGWQSHVFNKCTMNADGTATIPAWAVERWTRQIQTPYADLSESEKESDRREVRKSLAILDAKRGEPDVNALMLDAILTGLTGKPSQEGEP